MTIAGANPRWRKIWRYLVATAGLGLLVLAGLAWYVTTPSFQAMVRRRLVSELEKITGGRVELGSFHTTPFHLRVEVRDLTIHGSEKPGDVPYAHVGRVIAEVKIISALGFEFGFRSLILDHPVVHIVVYPDGTTNQPLPKVKNVSGKTPVGRLFALSIGRLEVRRGELLWNDQETPFDFTSNDVSAEIDYSILHRRYFGELLLGKVVTKLQDYRPVAWMAEAHFSLGTDSVDIGSLKVNSGRSRLQASGSVHNFLQPRIDANYDLLLDMQEVSAVAHRSEPRGGMAEAQGHGTWSLQTFSADGKVLLKDFGWRDQSLDLREVNVSTRFNATPQRLTLSELDARMLGGSIVGNVDVVGWLAEPRFQAVRTRMNEQKGTGQFRLKEVSVGGLADAVSASTLPFHRMNLAGAASGTIDLRWKGSPLKSDATFALQVVAPALPPSNRRPLNGRARGIYHGESGELEFADFSASTRATQIEAAGKLGRTGVLKLSVATSDLSELQSVLPSGGNPQKIPAILHGHASFTGTASGTLPNVSFTGNVQALDFDYLISSGAGSSELPVHADSFEANIQLSSRLFAIRNGTLQHGDATINFGVAGGLTHWQFASQSPLPLAWRCITPISPNCLPSAGSTIPHGERRTSICRLRGPERILRQAAESARQCECAGRSLSALRRRAAIKGSRYSSTILSSLTAKRE